MNPPDKKDSLLLRAARGESVERVPVWAMRQAGRWDPEFMQLRQGRGFFDFSSDVELASQASLLPVRMGVDAVILFYDITTLPVSMGLPFSLQPKRGPVPANPVRTREDVLRLNPLPGPETFASVRGMLKKVRERLGGSLPVLVFAGAPFTVAAYCIGTGKDMEATRQFARESPLVWGELLERLSSATIHYLNTLIAEGADAYQLFDSWAGMLSPEEYQRWAQEYHQRILSGARGVPRILFVKECPYLNKQVETPAEVISLGKRHDLKAARAKYPHLVFQGNVDEAILHKGTPEQVRAAVFDCLRAGGGHRHILNLNHGVDKDTPVANFQAFIQAAKEFLHR
ncbi:MAG: uroporphyrinogen decarboxylase [Gemmataceae bacterium]|nr:uroporphyrinogen decarboxylase [Gemmataceae bacterium]